ncbi:hypothetical protein EYF80_006636 [Liparis tanakae]|uniref:Uncharacterized protein n=1 Tax=Liparis tanakae TaxID=230148 RepID=A0A4Z2IYH3_9TELE|nr:hypothetical protein EYF80_006636 [Liparis tanakae]
MMRHRKDKLFLPGKCQRRKYLHFSDETRQGSSSRRETEATEQAHVQYDHARVISLLAQPLQQLDALHQAAPPVQSQQHGGARHRTTGQSQGVGHQAQAVVTDHGATGHLVLQVSLSQGHVARSSLHLRGDQPAHLPELTLGPLVFQEPRQGSGQDALVHLHVALSLEEAPQHEGRQPGTTEKRGTIRDL